MLSDVVPATIHLLVPRRRRWFRPPPDVTVHTATHPLGPQDVVVRQGIRVTAPVRTILDVAEAGTAPEQVILATRQACERGLIVAAALCQAAQQRDRRIQQLVDQALREEG